MRKAFLLVLIVLLARPAGVARYSADAMAVSQGSDRGDHEDDAPNETLPPNCIAKDACMETVAVAAARLKAEGPQMPAGVNANLSRVQGFVRDGWPVVVDFEPQPGTRTVLRVAFYDGTPATMLFPPTAKLVMDEGGLGGRRIFTGRIELPERAQMQAGRPVGVASFEVVSRFIKPNGKPGKYTSVQVYGIGAGPRAIGSITLTDVTLAGHVATVKLPPSGSIMLPYRYLLKESFDLVAEDIWRKCKGSKCSGVDTYRLERRRGERQSAQQVTKPGTYRLNVRAWLSCPTADFSKCGDDSAWATGQSARILVTP